MARYQDRKHPYLKGPVFWEDPKNHYWENDSYSAKTKENYREWVAGMRKTEKQLVKMEQ